MKIMLLIDLDRLLVDSKAKTIFEEYFGQEIPDDKRAAKALGISMNQFQRMLGYFVTKTMFGDDGRKKLVRTLG